VKDRKVIFWDFDGVIKESVAVKTEAYIRLFEGFGADLAARVRSHHEFNGGMSRFKKIPLYLGWAGINAGDREIDRYCRKFAQDVRDRVIASPWVPGARKYLVNNCMRQSFFLLTATPQAEIEGIVSELGLERCFRAVYGAPMSKSQAVAAVMARLGVGRQEALVIGDSESDLEAATSNGVDFLLRKTPLNMALQQRHSGGQCEDFVSE
jgi:phosphoglycolate phosphatase-like HAD superfamily hydrolase